MPDGYSVFIDEPLATRLKDEADAAGVPVDDHVRERLAASLDEGVDLPDFEIDERIARETLERGDGIPYEVFRERLKRFGRRAA